MSQKKILNNKYQLLKSLGEGSFGKVYLTKRITDKSIFATKILDINQVNSQDMNKYLTNEIKIMNELKDNENVIRLIELLQTKNHYYFIMEYCNGGSLSDVLKDYKLKYGKPFSQEIVQYYMRQIVNGLVYIHSHKIIHRDLKLENILINFKTDEEKKNLNLLKSKIKIIDFGLATKSSNAITLVGSPLYMDPLILKKYDKAGGYTKLQKYNSKADIWSLGAICYEMITGETLFNVDNLTQLIEKVEKGDYTIPLYIDISKEAISFLNSMLQYEGEKRLSAQELSKHSFLVKNVKDFTKPEFDKFSNKINNGEFEINTINNKTVWSYFNKEEIQKESHEQSDNNLINMNDENSYLKKINNNLIKDNNISQVKTIPMNIKKLQKPKSKFIDGYASPMKNRNRKKYNDKKIDNENRVYQGIKDSIMAFEEDEKQKNEEEKQIKDKIEENEEWAKYINGLLDEYKAAKYYFIKNKLSIQEKDANSKIIEIENIKNKYKQGNLKYLSNLPKPITPEYIYGYSSSERTMKFNKLIQKFNIDKNKLILKLESYKKFAITKNIKEEYERDKKKYELLNNVLKNISHRYKNEWAPAPEYIVEYQTYKVEKISYNNCEFKLKIETKINDNRNEYIRFIIYIIINDKKNIIKNIELKKENNFRDECIWSMKFNEWRNIDNNVENFIFGIENEQILLNNNNNSITVNIASIKNGKTMSFNVKIPNENKNILKVHFNVLPIIPEGRKYWDDEKKEYFILKRILPAFEGKSKLTSNPPLLSQI